MSQGKTTDGFESHFGVNHLAHFLLFELLKPLLLASSTPDFASRVVAVSSLIHRYSSTLINDPNIQDTPYDPALAYASSKTANIYFANEVERRYGAQGLHAISLHPGGIITGLGDHHDPRFIEQMTEMLNGDTRVFQTYKSIEQGAATTVLAAIGKAFEGQGAIYLDDCQVAPLHDPENETIYAPGYCKHAFDKENEEKLWQISLDMANLRKN